MEKDKKRSRYTKASKNATLKYQKKNLYCVAFRLNKNTEADLIEAYKSIPNKRQWLLDRLQEWKENSQ